MTAPKPGGNQHTRLNLNGDNAGFLVDIYPFGGKFYLTFCESTMRREGRDCFRFAERLRIYPVLQLSVGLQF